MTKRYGRSSLERVYLKWIDELEQKLDEAYTYIVDHELCECKRCQWRRWYAEYNQKHGR